MKIRQVFTSLSTTDLSDNNEKEVQIKDFGGVDYSHSSLFVDTSRATDMSNFIKDGGVSQKRKGWREIFQFPFTIDETTNNPVYSQINGVWELDTTSYNSLNKSYEIVQNVIVHANKKLYYMTKTLGSETTSGITNNANGVDSLYTLNAVEIPFPSGLDYSNLIKNEKSYGVVADERLYLLSGAYFMIGMFDGVMQIRKVEDDVNTYVPNTTITIPPNEYNNLLQDTDYALSSNSFDEVNMMTRYRNNKLQGLSYLAMLGHFSDYFAKENQIIAKKDSSGYGYYYVDSNGDNVEINVEGYITNTKENISNPLIYTYTLDSIPFDKDYNGTIEEKINNAVSNMILTIRGSIYTPSGEVEVSSATKVDSINDFYTLSGSDYLKKDTLLYYVEINQTNVEDDVPYGTCNLVFNYNVVPKTNEIHSINVRYSRYVGLADKINNCKFGCMFGLNNNNNRLFVSGNSTYPNIDYHSTEASTLSDDDSNVSASFKNSLTYFSDLSYSSLGGKVNQINGYAILGDGTMAILKTLSGIEPTIYFRKATSSTVEITDVNGNSYNKITEFYPITVGAIGEGSIGFDSIQNLNGDILMWSGRGVYGIELDSNVASSQRFAKCRSRLVDTTFVDYTTSTLENAVTTTYEDKYFLCIDSTCYIADARYPIQLSDDLEGDYQYEWWKWNNVPARIFFHYGNMLWFGTTTGMLCCFENKNYLDTSYLELSSSDICKVENEELEENDKFVINENYISAVEEMTESDLIKLNKNIYALGLEMNKCIITDGNTIVYDLNNDDSVEDKEYRAKFMNTLPNYKVCFDRFNSSYVKSSNTSVELYEKYIVSEMYGENGVYTFKVVNDESQDVVIDIENNPNMRMCLLIDEEAVGENNLLNVCNVCCKIGDTFYYLKNFNNEANGKCYFVDENGDVDIELDNKPKFQYFSLRDYTSEGRALKIVNYNEDTPVIDNGRFVFNKIVSCYYITPPFDFGTRMYNKDLRQLIIVPDTLLGTSVDFGFETKNNEKEFNAYTGRALNFNEIDFDYISFLTETFATVYCKTARVKRWSYIRFFFKSDTDNNCKINNLTIVYKLGTRNKGVR